MKFLKRVKGKYEVKAFLRVKKGNRTKKYVVKKRFDRKEFTEFLKTGRADYWSLSATQMRSILNLTSPEDWLYKYVDKDPGLGGDRSDPDFRPMDGYAWREVTDFISGPMDGWKGIDFKNENVFDIWYFKWSHLLKPRFPVEVELEIPLNKLKAALMVEVL